LTNFIELNCLYTTKLTVFILQLVTSKISFGLIWPTKGTVTLCTLVDANFCKPDDGQTRSKHVADITSCRIATVSCVL